MLTHLFAANVTCVAQRMTTDYYDWGSNSVVVRNRLYIVGNVHGRMIHDAKLVYTEGWQDMYKPNANHVASATVRVVTEIGP